jgi:hypothetical protein
MDHLSKKGWFDHQAATSGRGECAQPLVAALWGFQVIGIILCSLLVSSSAMAQMRVLTTNHYTIHTDVEPTLAQDLAKRMDVMFDEYSRRLEEFHPPQSDRLFDVYIYQHHGEYLHYTQNRFPNTGGVFIANKALAAFLEGQGRDSLRRTLQHEAFHQFAYSAIGPGLPVWLNEGLAQIFEEGIYDGERFSIGEIPPRRIRQLQEDIRANHIVDFRTFMTTSDQHWAENLADRERGASEYNQAWAMAHFLIFDTDERGEPRFRARLIDMLRMIHEGKSGQDAFVSAFSNNIEGFQQMFMQFASTIQPTDKASYIEHQDVLADMLVDLKSRGHSFSNVDSFRDLVEQKGYRMEYTKGLMHWITDVDPRDYFENLHGQDFGSNQLFFSTSSGAPIADLIARPMPSLQLHTHFIQSGPKIEHELLVEAQ